MAKQVLLMSCALGEIYLEHTFHGFEIVIPNVPEENWGQAQCAKRDCKLPGGKFTARSLLEAYLRDHRIFFAASDLEDPTRHHKEMTWNGTYHFTPEAVEMARAALEEWEGK